jgi:hypothetical protein
VAATASIRIIKEFTYRGALRRFSNRYCIGTSAPPDAGHWTTLADAICLAEKSVFAQQSGGGAKVVEAIWYGVGSEIPIFSKVYALDGIGSFLGGTAVPGDVAMIIRYSTPDRSTKNHPVYCFNYYHGMIGLSSGNQGDVPHAGQHAALATYGAQWLTGFSDGVTTFKRARPSGDLCNGVLVPTYFTHRDLPR